MSLTVALITAAVVAPVFLGVGAFSNELFRRATKDVEKENRELKRENWRLNHNIGAADQRIDALEKTVDFISSDRDRYAEVASSREIKFSTERDHVFLGSFNYDNTIKKNLQAIKKRLDSMDQNSLIRFEFSIFVKGSWKKYLQSFDGGRWQWGKPESDSNKQYTESEWGKIGDTLEGHPDEVFEELVARLKEPYWKIWKRDRWAIPNGVLSINVEIHDLQPKLSEPPEFLEVLHIQKEVEIIEVEKPVFMESDGDTHNVKDLESLIAAKIEVELEGRLKEKTELHRKSVAARTRQPT
jgi:hypothetical protein